MFWPDRRDKLTEIEFQKRYKMSKDSFEKLVHKLASHFGDKPSRRKALKGKRIPYYRHLQLSITLRQLGGGHYLDIIDIHGISESQFYKMFWECIYALPEIVPLSFPMDDAVALNILAEDFEKRSKGTLPNCVGALDGVAIEIQMPDESEQADARSFYNRKGFFSLNAQCLCDAKRRFLYVSIEAKGSTNDSLAIILSDLGLNLVGGKLLLPYYIVGDEAYKGIAPDCIICPYPGKMLEAKKDNFNYYQSVTRNNVECSFGILFRRFGILRRAMTVSLLGDKLIDGDDSPDAPRKTPGHAVAMFLACCSLHNYCIDMSGNDDVPNRTPFTEYDDGTREFDDHGEDFQLFTTSDILDPNGEALDHGESDMGLSEEIIIGANYSGDRRDQLAQHVKALGAVRPHHSNYSKRVNVP